MAKVTLDRDTFKALASETRLALLHSLDERRKTGTELARDLDLNKATVHEHLQLLSAVGLVKKADEGRKWIYYELSWQGRKLLHPDQGATFAVLLGMSVVSAGGAFAMLGRALDWWAVTRGTQSDEAAPLPESRTAEEPATDQDADQTSASPEPEAGSPAAEDAEAPQEALFLDDGAAPPDDDFWGDGGTMSLLMAALMLLFLALAAVLRFRAQGKS